MLFKNLTHICDPLGKRTVMIASYQFAIAFITIPFFDLTHSHAIGWNLTKTEETSPMNCSHHGSVQLIGWFERSVF